MDSAPRDRTRAPSVIDESQHRLVAVEARITHESTSDTPLRNRFANRNRPVTTTDLADVCLGNAPSLPPAVFHRICYLRPTWVETSFWSMHCWRRSITVPAGTSWHSWLPSVQMNPFRSLGSPCLSCPNSLRLRSLRHEGARSCSFHRATRGDQARAEQTGRWGLRHVQGRSRLATTLPTASTAMRSVTSLGHGRRWSWRVPDCSTANGCVESIGGETHERIFVQRMRCCGVLGYFTVFYTARTVNCWRLERRYASALLTLAMTSPHKRGRLPV